jgi:hypothetical protein
MVGALSAKFTAALVGCLHHRSIELHTNGSDNQLPQPANQKSFQRASMLSD